MSDPLRASSEAAAASASADAFWPVLAADLTKAFACERTTLFQAAGGGKLVSCHAQGLDAPLVIGEGEGLAGRAAAERATVRSNDVAADPRFSARVDRLTSYATRSLLAMPVLARGRVLGVVELLNKAGGFSAVDAAALEALAGPLALYFLLYGIEERQSALEARLLQLEKMAAIGGLVAGFTHEVRNPLIVIQGFADKLRGDLEGNAEAAADLDKIKKNVKRIEDLVRNLLGFSRASRATIGPVDLCEVVEATLQLVRVEPAWRPLEIAVELDRSAPRVRGNANTLMQVFLNLIVNALQAMQARGTGRVTVRIRPGADGREVLAEVADDGPGLAPETRDRIFEPFFTTKGRDGTGLGLHIVSGIVESHRGRIAVASEPGRGTTFSLSLPAAAA